MVVSTVIGDPRLVAQAESSLRADLAGAQVELARLLDGVVRPEVHVVLAALGTGWGLDSDGERYGSAPRHWSVGQQDLGRLVQELPRGLSSPNLYVCTGLQRQRGQMVSRTTVRCSTVWTLTLDCDLKDYLRHMALDVDPHEMSEAELAVLRFEHLQAIQTAVAGLPAATVVDSGWGYYLLYRLGRGGRPDWSTDVQRQLVQAVNLRAGWSVADPAVQDPATRLIRLPGTWNLKSDGDPRQASILELAPPTDLPSVQAALRSLPQPTRKTKHHGPIPAGIWDATRGLDTPQGLEQVLAPLWPREPSYRHHLAQAVAGCLIRMDCTVQEAQGVVYRLADGAGDEELGERVAAVVSAYQRHQSGQTHRGLPTAGLRTSWPVVASTPCPTGRGSGPEVDRRVLVALVKLALSKEIKPQPDGSVWVEVSVRKLAEMTLVQRLPAISDALRRLTSTKAITYHPGTSHSTAALSPTAISLYGLEATQEHTLSDDAIQLLERLRTSHALDRAVHHATTEARANPEAQEPAAQVPALPEVRESAPVPVIVPDDCTPVTVEAVPQNAAVCLSK